MDCGLGQVKIFGIGHIAHGTWYLVHGHIALVLELIDIGIDHNAKLDVSGCKHHLDFEK